MASRYRRAAIRSPPVAWSSHPTGLGFRASCRSWFTSSTPNSAARNALLGLRRHAPPERSRVQQRRRVNRRKERTIETDDGAQPCQQTVAEHRHLSRRPAPTNQSLLGTATDRHTLRMARCGRTTPRN